MSTPAAARLSLGPLLFNWPVDEVRDFYFRIADEAPIDIVCIGEVVCSKRAPFLAPYMDEIADRLGKAGKEVVYSTLALVMSARETAMVKGLAKMSGDDGRLIEANDVAGVALLAGKAHVVGPFVNVYNEGTLAWLAANGALRVSLPGEIGAGALRHLAAMRPCELEVQVFGRQPLALSARCYHARVHGLHKDGCQFVCAEDADGMALETLDGQSFLAVNGTQTLSHGYVNLIAEMAELVAMGIDCFRLWPHSCDMVAVARQFRDVLDGHTDAGAAERHLAEITGGVRFVNGFYHEREGAEQVAAQPGAYQTGA